MEELPVGFTIEERARASLESVRPVLKQDGGDVEFVRFLPSGVLEIRWLGTCARCPMSTLTLRAGVERTVMQDLPEVKRVEAVP
jgi:Fe-S cluster biogenesis protein NfuA